MKQLIKNGSILCKYEIEFNKTANGNICYLKNLSNGKYSDDQLGKLISIEENTPINMLAYLNI